MWNDKAKIIPLVVGSLGAIPKQFGIRLEQIGITAGKTQVQKTVLLGTAKILRKVLRLLVVAQFQQYFSVQFYCFGSIIIVIIIILITKTITVIITIITMIIIGDASPINLVIQTKTQTNVEQKLFHIFSNLVKKKHKQDQTLSFKYRLCSCTHKK